MKGVVSLVLVLLAATPGMAESVRFERLSERGLRLTLPEELGGSWRAVNVGRLQVRSDQGLASLARRALPEGTVLDLTLTAPGCSLFEVNLGPPSEAGRSDSWQRVTRCSKILACRREAGDDARRRAGVLVMGKTGSRIEIRPLFNPLLLLPGSDLPVRLYFEGESVPAGTVRALGPDDAELRASSDRVGIANLTIPSAGRWTLRFDHGDAEAELIFDVPAD